IGLAGGNKVGIAVLVQGHIVTYTGSLDAEGNQDIVQVTRKRGGIDVAIGIILAVAIGVLLANSDQIVCQLLIGIRYGATQQGIHKVHVDVHLIGSGRTEGQLLGQRVDFTVGVGAEGLDGGVFCHDGGEVRHIGRDQIGELIKAGLVLGNVGVGQGDGAEEGVGQVTGSQQQGFLLAPVSIVVGLPVNGNAGLLGNFLQESGFRIGGAP